MCKMVNLRDDIRGIPAIFDCEKAVYYVHGELTEVHIYGQILHVKTDEMSGVLEAHQVQVSFINQPTEVPVNVE